MHPQGGLRLFQCFFQVGGILHGLRASDSDRMLYILLYFFQKHLSFWKKVLPLFGGGEKKTVQCLVFFREKGRQFIIKASKQDAFAQGKQSFLFAVAACLTGDFYGQRKIGSVFQSRAQGKKGLYFLFCRLRFCEDPFQQKMNL